MTGSQKSAVDDFIDLLKARGVGPGELAKFIASMVGAPSAVARPGSENLPGFDFASRVGRVAGIALAAQTEAANRAWADMLQGTYTFGSAMRTWSRMFENYYDVLVELWRGPGYVPRPAWIFFDYAYSRSQDSWVPDTLKAPAKMDRLRTPETEPAPTEFVGLQGKGGSARLYKGYDWVQNELTVTLDPEEARKLEPGVYISFLFAKGRSSEAPLAIIALRVTHQD
jgi:hypothetical protein